MKKILFILLIIGSAFRLEAQDDVLKYSMKTPWTTEVDKNMPWPEYPRPQLVRDGHWKNLNGQWEYAISPTTQDGVPGFQGKILVPFAVESQLSGVRKLVGEKNYLWYKRTFDNPDLADGERLILNFGAVDWEAGVFINGEKAGSHKGGYDAFSFDITQFLKDGEQELIVRVWDPSDFGTQPRGKQVANPEGIWYTPVTGIWQTVWLEKAPEIRVSGLKLTPDIDNRVLGVELFTTASVDNLIVEISALNNGKEVGKTEYLHDAGNTSGKTEVEIPQPVLWSPENPFLYDLKLTIKTTNGKVLDEVSSYFGMRKVSLGKDSKGYTRIMLNDKPLFQFGLLDQGWWPDGLYTAPNEEAMMYDVVMTKKMGFNMLRKHVKVEPARYYYNCDKMGMLVWQDMPNGNYRKELRIQAWEPEDAVRSKESSIQFELELKRMMDQFHSYPSILVWVPFNEGWGQYDTKRVTEWVENYDKSRIIDSPSGWADRGVGDVVDVHLYPGPGMKPVEQNRVSVLGEFGGLGYPVKKHLWWNKKNWGYLTYQTKEEFENAFEQLINGLKGVISTGLSAAIYTQTTDVEGEVNGLITYDREVVKMAPEKLKSLIEPLYNEYWDARFLVACSEQSPNDWNLSAQKPEGNWQYPEYDDFEWTKTTAPFSTFHNVFLDETTEWNGNDMYLRKSFTAETLPQVLYLKHYIPKASAKIYLNGHLIADIKDQGGRKRLYTDVDISQYANLLNKGTNVLSAEVHKLDNEASFDIGLYTSEIIKNQQLIKSNERFDSSN